MPSPIKYDREQRARWYLQVDKYNKSVVDVSKIFGISRKTYYKWRNNDFKGKSVHYKPFKGQPRLKINKEVGRFIKEQKDITNYGSLKMKYLVKRELGIDLSTTIIYRFYKKRRLIRKPQKRSPWYAPMKYALTVKNPGEGVQMDIKYVYESGKRKYQFSVFDPFTKKYHFSIFSTKESRNAVVAFKRAERYFKFKIVSVQTDNGSEFRGVFHSWLSKKKTPHYFIPKKSPWWNCNVERVHRTIDDEYYHNPYRKWKTVYQWLDYYNYQRLHLSLNGLTPEEKLKSVTLEC